MKRRLSIVHVVHSFEIGGAEQLTLSLATEQRRRGHRVQVLAVAPGQEGPLAKEYEAHGIEVRTVSKRARLDPTLPVRLAMEIRKAKARIVHTHNPPALVYGAPAARLAGVPVIHTKHGENRDLGRRMAIRQILARLTDAFVAVSEATAAHASRNAEAPEERIQVVENGINLRRFYPDEPTRAAKRRELELPERAWVFGIVGRLSPEKGHEVLLRAISPLLGPKARLLVIGDGPLRSQIQQMAEDLDVRAWIGFTGAQRCIPELLRALDTLVIPSLSEGLPLVLPEAMATGLPVIASAVGGIPKVVAHDQSGLLVSPQDVTELRRALERIVSSKRWARNLGRTARELAQRNHSIERVANEYDEVYTNVLNRRLRSPGLALREAVAT